MFVAQLCAAAAKPMKSISNAWRDLKCVEVCRECIFLPPALQAAACHCSGHGHGHWQRLALLGGSLTATVSRTSSESRSNFTNALSQTVYASCKHCSTDNDDAWLYNETLCFRFVTMRASTIICVQILLTSVFLVTGSAYDHIKQVLSSGSSCEMTYMYSGYEEVPDLDLIASDQAAGRGNSSNGSSSKQRYSLYRYLDTSIDAGAGIRLSPYCSALTDRTGQTCV